MDIYFDFVSGGSTQSKDYLISLEMHTQLSSLQSLAQVISLTEVHFISGNCCHNVLIKVNASLGIHTQSEPYIPNSLGTLWQSRKNFTFLCIINIFSSANAFFLLCSNRDFSAGSMCLQKPLRIFRATQSVGELLKDTHDLQLSSPQ